MKKPQNYSQEKIAALQNQALKLWHADNNHAKKLGLALVAVRAAMPHGAFTPWWKEQGLTQARVSYCMRLASNKVAEAKEKQQSAFQGAALATKPIRKELNEFLAFAAKFDSASAGTDESELFYTKFAVFVGHTLVNIGKLPGWKMRETTHLHVELASKGFQRSLRYLMACLFNKQTPFECNPIPQAEEVQPARLHPLQAAVPVPVAAPADSTATA
jgi:hypothetical protein